MTDEDHYPLPLTAEELLLLRQRLSDGPGLPAVNSELDAKLYAAQVVLQTRKQRPDLYAGLAMAGERDCQLPCDADCEIGPVHCWNYHRPNHKPDWHDPQECDQGR